MDSCFSVFGNPGRRVEVLALHSSVGCARPMAPSDEEVNEARAWLGEENGGIELPDELVEIMVAGFEAELWTMNLVTLNDKLSVTKAGRLWAAVLRDSSTAAGETPSDTEKAIFEIWIQGLFENEDEGNANAGKKYTPSQDEMDDIHSQGMVDWKEMRHGEFALYIGRPGTDAEIENGEYRTPPYNMKGVRDLAKIAKGTTPFFQKLRRGPG